MAFDNSSAPKAQVKPPLYSGNGRGAPPTPLNIGDVLTFTPRIVDKRAQYEEEDGGGVDVRFFVSKADQFRFGGAKRIDISQTDDEPPVELYQQLILTVTGFDVEDWGRYGPTRILQASADPVPFEPRYYPKVEGIPANDCRNLEKKFGSNFAEVIASDFLEPGNNLSENDPAAIIKARPLLERISPEEMKEIRERVEASVVAETSPLSKSETRYSKPKQISIINACIDEIQDAREDTAEIKKLIAMLCACYVGKRKARQLTAVFDKTKSPYQHFFTGRMSFLEADLFAHLFDPDRAAEDRNLAIAIGHFLGSGSIVVDQSEGKDNVWKNFGFPYVVTDAALDRLTDLGVMQKVEMNGSSIEVGSLVSTEAYGDGVVTGTTKGFNGAPDLIHIKFEKYPDNTVRWHPEHLRENNARVTRPPSNFFGLARFVEAERSIAKILAANHAIELSEEVKAVIQRVIDNAASFLDRPDFKLSSEQIKAIWRVFKNRFSVITGPPGTGKAAIVALINVIATMIYQIELPGFGVALTALAANNMRETATGWWKNRAIPMEASTIHKALGMEPTDDDDYVANGKIVCGVFFCDEMRMNSSPLVNTILMNSDARHTVFIGDADQLQPIGAGKPFQDIVASGAIPTTWLTRNYRTNCAGIRALCEDIKAKEFSSGNVTKYETLGGVQFLPCDRSAKADTAADVYADLATKHNPYQIAILTPHNQGDGGTRTINLSVREALGLPPDRLVKGDMLLVVANNYKVQRSDGRGTEVIRNGERCSIVKVGPDLIDVEFPKTSEGIKRRVQFLTSPKRLLPVGVEFGYALSIHKAQGSQFPVVIAIAEPGTKAGGIVQASSIYTCCSRARDRLIVIGNLDDFAKASHAPEITRNTLLLQLLKGGNAND